MIATLLTGTPMSTPYFIKSRNVYLTSCLFKIPIHMIPAKAPTGVINAPILLPIIEAYKAPVNEFGFKLVSIEEYKTDIGILLSKLAMNNDENP